MTIRYTIVGVGMVQFQDLDDLDLDMSHLFRFFGVQFPRRCFSISAACYMLQKGGWEPCPGLRS